MKNRMVATMLLLPSCGKLDIVFDYNQHYLYYEKSRRLQAKSSENMPEKSQANTQKVKYPRIRNEISMDT